MVGCCRCLGEGKPFRLLKGCGILVMLFMLIQLVAWKFGSPIFLHRGPFLTLFRYGRNESLVSGDSGQNGTCVIDTSSMGRITVVESGNLSMPVLEAKFPDVQMGGRWRPSSCRSRQRVAIVVPYRDRYRELCVFLNHMHPFLQRQQLDYTIYLIEQSPGVRFNRGMLFNIGFLEVMAREEYDCFVLHDVDVLPEDDRILYNCKDNPQHLSAACSRWGYKLLYATVFGGVTTFSPRQFLRVNGYSNGYFGWGAEDDDLYNRVTDKGYRVLRYPIPIARFKTLSHASSPANQNRMYYLNRWKQRNDRDGLNSAVYNITGMTEKKLYTHFAAHIDMERTMAYVDAFFDPAKAAMLTTISLEKIKNHYLATTPSVLSNKTDV